MFATIGCTRDNPAFNESTGTAGTTTEDDSTNTSVEVETDSGQEAPDPECSLQPGVSLEIDLGPGGCADTPETYDRYHPLLGIEGSTLLVGTCPMGATACTPACETAIPTPLSFAPLDLTGIASTTDCLHIHARRVDPSNPDACGFESVVIETANVGTRQVVMIGRNTAEVMIPPIDAADPLFGFSPEPVPVEDCPCADFPDACCEGIETTLYALDIGLPEAVQIGDTKALVLPNRTYDFTTLDAFQLGECGKPPQESWGLVAK